MISPYSDPQSGKAVQQKAQREVLTVAILIGAALLFVLNGGTAIGQALRTLTGLGAGVEQVLTVAVLLNVALILFGYRRYRDLKNEVAHRVEAEERAHSLAATDALTGFYNRRSLQERSAALLTGKPGKQACVAVMMLDLDHFKTVNDIHGHAAGDIVLKTVADRIAAVLPGQALAARLGGDEFACVCPLDPADPDATDRLADAIVTAVGMPIPIGNSDLVVSTSLGIARSDRDGGAIDMLLRRADMAMYAAKNAGRNRHIWFTSPLEQEINRRNAIEEGMRGGIAAGEFIPYYEPQVDMATGQLLGFEMLARWESPQLGLVSPEHFIPIAEESGMIGDLSLAVMRRAFDEARDWDGALTLSVNISPIQLRDPWLSQKIVKLLAETGFPARRLEIEITESALFENLELAQSTVQSLKNQGIRIALDDFGTGYSSLAHLRALPFDRIKIDRSFVASMGENAQSAAIVHAIAKLGESLGLPVTAEGVETMAIEISLQGLGMEQGQGWHFGKPMTATQARRFLADRGLQYGVAPDVSPTETLADLDRHAG